MKHETAAKAAKWWADKLRGMPLFDNGDTSQIGSMASMLAILARSSMPDHTEAQITAFETALTDVILKANPRWFSIGVDYHPDYMLSEAAQAAGINVDMHLPWKTMMNIRDDVISVAEGYQSSWVTL